jgi:hypothetical protein
MFKDTWIYSCAKEEKLLRRERISSKYYAPTEWDKYVVIIDHCADYENWKI